MFSSNQQLIVTGDTKDNLIAALTMVSKLSGSKVEAYTITDNGIEFLWYDEVEGSCKLPAPMSLEALSDFVSGYLSTATYIDPDDIEYFDGSVDKGWLLECGKGNFEGHEFYVICRIKPYTTLYSK